ncbi:DNA-formamidopyrimidine glycosylase [Lacticaseibacillus mingshuiensis]|uniref:Formamidopyrimidine-DNA glycosylase n=1 Tax=Lacticaseibacillus mingshuiensis TaxID=2799574 RepID=A0ABW4CIV2_9LACO|nr:DNA-formamidopyrimidine glycosylase [Lacticaseibacillus mingshuiensis]
MPELPEVENVRRGLSKLVVGKTVTAVDTNWPKTLIGGLATFRTALIGRTITGVDRRGKYLLIRFDQDLTLVSHLRMEGKYQLAASAGQEPPRFMHVWFTFSDGSQMRYADMRKFGRMQLVQTGTEETAVSGLAKIGPEPDDPSWTSATFYDALHRRKAPIKSVLLDQTVVAGIGNIYADETLWLSQLSPLQPAATLKREEVARLHDNIIQELATATELGGTTVHSFLDAGGHTGRFQEQLHVYGQEGTPCARCGTEIQKTKVGERGTHFCPHCQPLRKRQLP